MSPVKASACTYGENPFLQAQTGARYLREHPPPQASLAVLGSEPEIYFHAHCHSATGYIYTYGLRHRHGCVRRHPATTFLFGPPNSCPPVMSALNCRARKACRLFEERSRRFRS